MLSRQPMTIHEVRESEVASGEVVQGYFKAAKKANRLNMVYREDGTPEYTFSK
jgi:hypothetical protein